MYCLFVLTFSKTLKVYKELFLWLTLPKEKNSEGIAEITQDDRTHDGSKTSDSQPPAIAPFLLLQKQCNRNNSSKKLLKMPRDRKQTTGEK